MHFMTSIFRKFAGYITALFLVSHALAAGPIVIPGQDSTEFQAALQTWLDGEDLDALE